MNKLLFLSSMIICLLSTSVFSKEFSNSSLQTEYPNNKQLNSDILLKKVEDINSKNQKNKEIGIPLKYSTNNIRDNPSTKFKKDCPYCMQLIPTPTRATSPSRSPCYPQKEN